MKRILFFITCLTCNNIANAQLNFSEFQQPGQSYQPWVYWMWVNGNATAAGIEKDLLAMHHVGINGAIILDVDQKSPNGQTTFANKQWQAVFKKSADIAGKLGMELGINNGAGYFGSGGPWVKPELGLQWVVSSETYITGGKTWRGVLKNPGSGSDYRDIAVIAIHRIDTTDATRFTPKDFVLKICQNPGNAGIKRYSAAPYVLKQLQYPSFRGYIAYRGVEADAPDAAAPDEAVVAANEVINVTDKMNADGTFTWNAPVGDWTIIRFGHQWTGSCIGPVIPEVQGPEIDRMNIEATRLHFDSIIRPLKKWAGNTSLTLMHTDSWEGGGLNWTSGFEKTFRERRGYDIMPWMPVFAGRIVGSLAETERFMQDLRTTISELFVENYMAELHRLINQEGLKFSGESYTTPANDLHVSNFIDLPMCEFWISGTGPDFSPTIKLMSSVAHLKGLKVVSAEALTANGKERWQYHPARMKAPVDEAFCGGVNRLVFHRYSQQNFDNYPGPGNQMNAWGCKYERTNTWWEYSKPWHEYIARCQFMLQNGTVQADVLALQTEEPRKLFQGIKLSGYNYTVIGTDMLDRIRADIDGMHLPNRPAYRLLLLPDYPYMSVEMLSKIRDLVYQGAVVLGNRPLTVPGLHNYKEKETQLYGIANELWGKGTSEKVRKVGKGFVFSGVKPEEVLSQIGVKPDFSSDKDIKFIHLTNAKEHFYFLSNGSDREFVSNCFFRVNAANAQLWDAETGKRYNISLVKTDGGMQVDIHFGPSQSWFLIFGKPFDKKLEPYPQKHTDTLKIIQGAWDVSFVNGLGAPDKTHFDTLISWDRHTDQNIKYYSGTARYTKTIKIEPSIASAKQNLYLDLGKVEVMARLKMNGKDLGIAWHAPYRFNISGAVIPGDNKIEIEVVNLWPNRLIGDEQFADDIGYDKSGTMANWPNWLINNTERPVKERKVFSARRQWNKDDVLLPSGLIGPITFCRDKGIIRTFRR